MGEIIWTYSNKQHTFKIQNMNLREHVDNNVTVYYPVDGQTVSQHLTVRHYDTSDGASSPSWCLLRRKCTISSSSSGTEGSSDSSITNASDTMHLDP